MTFDSSPERMLSLLETLVAFDTQNPPRAMDAGGIFAWIKEQLGSSFDITIEDLGSGQVYLYARRGSPRWLFNVHLDTVPVCPGWTRDPHRLAIEDGRVTGLGACDIKGAAAALIAAVQESDAPCALLFSSDEELGGSVCVATFLQSPRAYEGVVVAEPTSCRAVLAHRGIATATVRASGTPGHASASRALEDSAIHAMVRWGAAALDVATQHERAGGELPGLRLNLGVIEGGQKPNMIAGDATIRLGVRPGPSYAIDEVLHELASCGPDSRRIVVQRNFEGPALPATPELARRGRTLATTLGLECAPAVDFWTEAALFSRAGLPTVVFGPGDIAQAHAADEFVAVEQLQEAAARYRSILLEHP